MNEHEVLSQINALLQKVAGEALAAVNAEASGWDQLVVSVKWADDDTGVFDTIIESMHGTDPKYHSAELSRDLIALWDVPIGDCLTLLHPRVGQCRRTRPCSRPAGHDGFSQFDGSPAPPAKELWRSATVGRRDTR